MKVFLLLIPKAIFLQKVPKMVKKRVRAIEISSGSGQVKLSAEKLNGMAKALNAIVGKFKM